MKKQKDRITLMACSNATGTHKLPLMFIGKAANPRCFKNLNKSSLPVAYFSQKNAWANCEIFTKWFYANFVPAVRKHLTEMKLPIKALLLLDNAPAHPETSTITSEDGKIKSMFLPPNTTAIIQPMDQGVLEAMKRRYRKAMLHNLLLEDQEGRSIIEFVKKINMKDVVYMSAAAWEDIPASTLLRSWNKLLRNPSIHASSTSEEGESQSNTEQSQGTSEPTATSSDDSGSCESLVRQLDKNLTDEDVTSWLYEDSADPGYQLLSDEDIIDQVTSDQQIEESDDDVSEPEDVPTSGEVAVMMEKCMLWYEKQDESTATSLMLLKRVKDLAIKKRYTQLKQTKIHSFFQ